MERLNNQFFLAESGRKGKGGVVSKFFKVSTFYKHFI